MVFTTPISPPDRRVIDRTTTKAYLVGAGIASMATAAFLIRDGDLIGRNITILEGSEKIGGSLDGCGSPETGYLSYSFPIWSRTSIV